MTKKASSYVKVIKTEMERKFQVATYVDDNDQIRLSPNDLR